MGWQSDYRHERVWNRTDLTRPNIPAPQADDTLTKAMRDYLQGRNLDYLSARRAGWFAAVFYGPRIIIPCIRTDGGTWWQARLIGGLGVEAAPENIKVLPPGTQKRWQGCRGYRHDAVCFIHGDSSMPTIIVEGPMDALAAAGLGYPACAILGVDPPKVVYDHVAKLVARSYLRNKAIILPDMDRVARWQETQQELGQRGVNGVLRQIPGGYKDLAECPLEFRKEFLSGTNN